MLKKIQNKEKISGNTFFPFLLSILCLTFSLLLFWLGWQTSAENYYQADRRYDPSQIVYDEVAVAVYTIVPVQMRTSESTDKIYLITHDHGQALLEAPVADKEVKDLIGKSNSLRDKPVYLKVKILSGAEVGEGYSDIASDLNASSERQVPTDSYVSLSKVRWEEGVRHIGIGLLLLVATFFLASAIWREIKLRQVKKELFTTYPELEGKLSNLLQADYQMKDLGLLIYGHHLISLAKGIQLIDIRTIVQIQTVIYKRAKATTLSSDIVVEILLNNNQKKRLPIKKTKQEAEMRLEELYDAIRHFRIPDSSGKKF